MIGTGDFARRHLQVLSRESEVEIVGHVSALRERAEAQAKDWGGHAYGSAQDLVRGASPDAVWISVAPSAHGAIESALIDGGVPFFVEKPVAVDLATAESIAVKLERRRVIAAVGYHWRAMDTIPEVRSVISSRSVRLVEGTWLDTLPPCRWWHKRDTGGGQIIEQATHPIDLARSLVGGAEVLGMTESGARSDEIDVAMATAALLRFGNGAPGVFTAANVLEGPAAVYLRLVCDGMLITIQRNQVTYETGRRARDVLVRNDPIVDEGRAFLQAVRSRDQSKVFCTYPEALESHRLCCAIAAAAR
ncbi:MAG TPA: Gfo/Idh/MocA family oxidoreductase [bacterium]|nr:Gfo/Idh/MocA family oxidoreductase [bacterium]